MGDKLKDSQSTRWRWPTISGDLLKRNYGDYCGWLNTKNGFGAYGGFRLYKVFLMGNRDKGIVRKPFKVDFTEANSADANYFVIHECGLAGYPVNDPPPAQPDD